MKTSVLQEWTQELTLMQQSVLIAGVRGPDGIRKDHPVKVLCRWFRRSFLVSAFERKTMWHPGEEGGGSFTGPVRGLYVDPQLNPASGNDVGDRMLTGWAALDWYAKEYLRYVDELPHHFQLHLMHGAEILGYKHPDTRTRMWWHEFYRSIVNDMHLKPEAESAMDKRLGDKEADWRAAEEVTAK